MNEHEKYEPSEAVAFDYIGWNAASVLSEWIKSDSPFSPRALQDNEGFELIETVAEIAIASKKSLDNAYEVDYESVKVNRENKCKKKFNKPAELVEVFFNSQLNNIEAYCKKNGFKKVPIIQVDGGTGGRPPKDPLGRPKSNTSIRVFVRFVDFVCNDEEPNSILSELKSIDHNCNGENASPELPVPKNTCLPSKISYTKSNPEKSLIGGLIFNENEISFDSLNYKIFYRWPKILSAILCVLLIWSSLYYLFYDKFTSENSLYNTVAALITSVLLFYFGVLDHIKLLDDRVRPSPDFFIRLNEKAQMEIVSNVSNDKKHSKNVRLVKYIGHCSICGSDVHVVDGGKEFHGRMIGRCSSSPREHVFSFDRITASGKLLYD